MRPSTWMASTGLTGISRLKRIRWCDPVVSCREIPAPPDGCRKFRAKREMVCKGRIDCRYQQYHIFHRNNFGELDGSIGTHTRSNKCKRLSTGVPDMLNFTHPKITFLGNNHSLSKNATINSNRHPFPPWIVMKISHDKTY